MIKSGTIGLLTIILISLLLVGAVGALEFKTVYNPFTRQLDYYRTGNFTGENVTASFFIGDGSLLTNLPSSADGVGFYIAQGPFLYNTSASTIQFNGTLLNSTILDFVSANQSYTNVAFRNETNNFTGQIIAPIVNGVYYVKAGNATDFQHVINSCSSSQTTGCTIFVAPGVMNTTQPIILSKDNLLIYAYNVNLQGSLGNNSLIMTNMTAIRNAVIYGLNVTNRGTGGREGYGFNLSEFRDAQLYDVSADNFEVGIFIDKYYNILQKPIVRRANVGIRITGNTNKVIKSRVSGSTNWHYEIAGVGNNLDSPNAETINNNTYGYVIRGFWNTVNNPYAEGLPGENTTAYWLPGTGVEINNGYASNVNTSVLDTGRGNSFNPRFSRQRVIASAENVIRIVGSGFTGSGSVEISPQSVDGSPAYVDVFNSSNSNTNVLRLFSGTGNTTSFVINNGQIVQGSFAPGLNLVMNNGSNTYTGGAVDQHLGGGNLRSVGIIQATTVQVGYNLTSNGTVNNWVTNWRGIKALSNSNFFFDNSGTSQAWFFRNETQGYVELRPTTVRFYGVADFKVDSFILANRTENRLYLDNNIQLDDYLNCIITTNSSGDVICGSLAGNFTYTNLALTNQSNTFSGNITADYITGNLNLSQKANKIYVDNYASIQEALDAGGNNSIIYFDADNYTITSTLYFYNNQILHGAAYGRTTIGAGLGFNGESMIAPKYNDSQKSVIIEQISIDCNSRVETGMHFNNTVISWVRFFGARECTQNNVWLEDNNYYFYLTDGDVRASPFNGVRSDDNSVEISRLRMANVVDINITAGNKVELYNNEIDNGNSTIQLYINGQDVDVFGGRLEGGASSTCVLIGPSAQDVRLFGTHPSTCTPILYSTTSVEREVSWFGLNDDTKIGPTTIYQNGSIQGQNFSFSPAPVTKMWLGPQDSEFNSATFYIGNISQYIGFRRSNTASVVESIGNVPLSLNAGDGRVFIANGNGINNSLTLQESTGKRWTIKAIGRTLTFGSNLTSNAITLIDDGSSLSLNVSKGLFVGQNLTVDGFISSQGKRVLLVNETSINDSYTNIAFTNQSNTFTGTQNFAFINSLNWSNVTILSSQVTNLPAFTDTNETARILALIADDCAPGTVVSGVQANGTVLCVADATGGAGMSYTNLALVNQTNTFAENQFFSKNVTLTNGYFSLTNNDVVASSTALNLVYIEALNESFDRPIMRIIGHSTNGGEADVRIDSPNPDIEFIESDQVSPDGKFELAGQGDELQFNSRTSTDDSFDTFFKFKQKQDATSSTPLARLIFDSNNSLTSVLRLENEANSAGAATALEFYNVAGDVVSAGIRSKSGASHTNAILSFWTADATKTQIERLNISNTGNITVDILRGAGLGCVGVDAEGHLYRTGTACGTGSMDYTNLALVNNTNNYTAYQQFSANASVLDTAGNGIHVYSNNTITSNNWTIGSNAGSAKLVLGGSKSLVASVTESAISLSTFGSLPFELKSSTGLNYLDGGNLDNSLIIRDSAGNDITLKSGGGLLKISGENQGNIANFIDNATGKGFNVTGFITAQGLITSQGQRVLLANESGASFNALNVAFVNNTNTFTQENVFGNTTRITAGSISPSTVGAASTAFSIITNQNGSYGSIYQQNILTGDGQTGMGAYFLFNTGGGTVLTNRTIYGTQNELYVGTNGNSTNRAQGFNNFNYGGRSGSYSDQFSTTNIILDTAFSGQSINTYNLITCGGNLTTCAGEYTIINSTNAIDQKTMFGNVIQVTPSHTNDTAVGLAILSEGNISVNNPTSQEVGLLLNWTVPGTDNNKKRWGLYVAHTPNNASQSYFGDPVFINGTGTALVVNGQSNFNDATYFNNLAGFFATTYAFAPIQVIGASGGTFTLNDAVFSSINTASTIPMAQFINTNSSAIGQLSFTSSGFPGGGQLNLYTGGSNVPAVDANSQFNNRSVIQGANSLDIGIENVVGHITLRATAGSNQAQFNLTASDLWLRVNQTSTGYINLSTTTEGGSWIGGCHTYWNGTDEIKEC